MKQHYVKIYCPGTIVAEVDTRKVDSWDVDEAVKMADSIVARHSARPYGFSFTTRSRGPEDLDAKETARSCFYHLGGEVQTLEEIRSRNDPKDKTLICNMEVNGYEKVIVNRNSWMHTAALGDDDVILDYTPPDKPEEGEGRDGA